LKELPEEVRRLTELIADVLSLYLEHPFRLILFGSFARGDASPFSDLDLAVDAGSEIEGRLWSRILFEVEELPTLRKIDLVDLWKAPEALKKAIEKEGIVIYGA
jgi:predicted nucleotidyltransferase